MIVHAGPRTQNGKRNAIIGLGLFVLLLLGFTFYSYFKQSDIELYSVSGQLRSAYINSERWIMMGEDDYMIMLRNDDTQYVINDCNYAFRRNAFEKSVFPGDNLTLLVEKKAKPLLGEEYQAIYGLEAGGRTYLDTQDVMAKQRSNANGVLWLGVAFLGIFIFCIASFIRNCKSERKRAEEQRNVWSTIE